MRLALSLLLLLCLCPSAPAAWKNGKTTTDVRNPYFGGHDWIALKAHELAAADMDIDFIKGNELIYYYGTEAPDNGLLPGFRADGKYADKGKCHCIIFGPNGAVLNERAASRVTEEYANVRRALAQDDRRMAAFYAGAMSHYLADLGQFMHMMGADPRAVWGQEAEGIHGNYEDVMDKELVLETVPGTNTKRWASTFLEGYIRAKPVPGRTPRDVTLAVARFVGWGGDSRRDVKKMHDEYLSYKPVRGKRSDPRKWSKAFRDQTGANINEAINGIATLLVRLGNK